jgi:hypothetical protein
MGLKPVPGADCRVPRLRVIPRPAHARRHHAAAISAGDRRHPSYVLQHSVPGAGAARSAGSCVAAHAHRDSAGISKTALMMNCFFVRPRWTASSSRPAHPRALQRATVKDGPQGHRSSRRAASLRAVRCNARLWTGGDVSDGLTGDCCRRPGSAGGRNRSGRALSDQSVTSRVTMGTQPLRPQQCRSGVGYKRQGHLRPVC